MTDVDQRINDLVDKEIDRRATTGLIHKKDDEINNEGLNTCLVGCLGTIAAITAASYGVFFFLPQSLVVGGIGYTVYRVFKKVEIYTNEYDKRQKYNTAKRELERQINNEEKEFREKYGLTEKL